MIAKFRKTNQAVDPGIVAVQGLGFIAQDNETLERFLTETGCEPGQIRERAADPAFLAGVLDFILNWEPRLIAFAAQAGIAPEEVVKARAKLPGGERE